MTFTSHAGGMGYAKRLIKPTHREITIVPTGGISVNGKRYMGNPGSQPVGRRRPVADALRRALAVSGNNGETFPRITAYRPNYKGSRRFQQVAMMKDRGFVYVYTVRQATRYGRCTSHVCRRRRSKIGAYEYWSVTRWVKNAPSAAAPIAEQRRPASCRSPYNRYLGRYVSLATRDGATMRHVPEPEGAMDRRPQHRARQRPDRRLRTVHPPVVVGRPGRCSSRIRSGTVTRSI